MYAGDVLAEPDGDAVMLIDETGQNWPMKCIYSRCLYILYVLSPTTFCLALTHCPIAALKTLAYYTFVHPLSANVTTILAVKLITANLMLDSV